MQLDSLVAGDSGWAMPIITDEKGFFYATSGSWIFWTPRTSEAPDLFHLLARFKIQLLSGDQIHWWFQTVCEHLWDENKDPAIDTVFRKITYQYQGRNEQPPQIWHDSMWADAQLSPALSNCITA
jgi:hypothetical protein